MSCLYSMAHIWPIYGPYMATYGPYMVIYGPYMSTHHTMDTQFDMHIECASLIARRRFWSEASAPRMSIYGNIYGHVWPIYGHIWPYMGHIWPYMAIYGPYLDMPCALLLTRSILREVDLHENEHLLKFADFGQFS